MGLSSGSLIGKYQTDQKGKTTQYMRTLVPSLRTWFQSPEATW